jgi:hypothetical protein
MKIIRDKRLKRIETEMSELLKLIPNGCFSRFDHPFPEFMSEPGLYSNNIAFVGRIDAESPKPVGDYVLVGPILEYCYIRDDRDRVNAPSTTHVNVDYRTLARTKDCEIVSGHSRSDIDHYSLMVSTAMPYIEASLNIVGLPDSGPLSLLSERGIGFKILNSIED